MKQLLNTLIRAALVVIVIILLVYVCLVAWLPDMCGNDIHVQILSPDKRSKAVVFQRDCGATTSFSTQLSIINASDELPNERGNIFSIKGHPQQVAPTITWQDDKTLRIHYKLTGKEYLAKESIGWFNKISVEYQN